MSKTYIPLNIQCFWCNGQMKRGVSHSGSDFEHATYFCQDCGAVSHFAVNHKVPIDSISVEYLTTKKPGEEHDD